jgi:hypothetical protein
MNNDVLIPGKVGCSCGNFGSTTHQPPTDDL